VTMKGIDHDTDVVIVGAGAAGAAAALEIDDAGGSFVGIDALDTFGGTAATSGGGVCVGGTSTQRTRGIEDSPALALRDHLAAGDGEADEPWARFYHDHAANDVHDWLIGHGVEFVDVHGDEHSAVDRWHAPDGSGRGLMTALHGALRARQIADRWHYRSVVEELVTDLDGRVTGVVARTAAGERFEARARAVVMATGGFAGDHDMVLHHSEALRRAERVLIGGGVGATGRGHRLLEAHGAELGHLDDIWTYAFATPDPLDPEGHRGLVIRGMESAIWVNRAGRRFVDESRPGPGSATPLLLTQEGGTCWAILDRAMLARIRIADPRFRGDEAHRGAAIAKLIETSPTIARGGSPAGLARAAGIDAEAFDETFRDWAALLASGVTTDPLTGRELATVMPFGEPPLHAIQFLPLARKNLGGVRTDLRGRVQTPARRPIDGLYAAGELAGFGGGHLAGRRALEGIMIGGSLFSGRVAGAWAAHEAGRARPDHLDAAAAPR
jgi:predicted oxidoreductase